MLTLRRAVMFSIINPIVLSVLCSFEIMYGANRRVVNTAACLLANQAHFIQHLETVAKQTHLAALVVVPSDRNLFQVQTCAESQVQQLHIKSEAIDRRRFNQRPAHAHAKSFKAALRVPEW